MKGRTLNDKALLTAEGIQNKLNAMKFSFLHTLCKETASAKELDDDSFVRLLECVLELTHDFNSLAKALGIDVAHLQALTTSGKRSCLHEIPVQDRKVMIQNLIQTTYFLLGGESRKARELSRSDGVKVAQVAE